MILFCKIRKLNIIIINDTAYVIWGWIVNLHDSDGTWLFFQYMYDFLEAVITSQTSKEEAYRKLEEMAKNQTETLSKLTKQVLAGRGHLGDKFTFLPQYC